MQHSCRKGFVIVVALPLIIAGLWLIARGAHKFYLYFSSANWPTVEAEIVEAALVKSAKDSRGGSSTGIRGKFTYEFNGQRYTSEHLDITGGYNNNVDDKKAKLAILIEAKARGQKVKAFVNPADPAFAIIFREISFDMFGYFIVGALSFFMGRWLGRFSNFWPWQPERKDANKITIEGKA
jgi:hypothetical protein